MKALVIAALLALATLAQALLGFNLFTLLVACRLITFMMDN